MRLFEKNEIEITKIYTVARYKMNGCCHGNVMRYPAHLSAYELICFLSGDNRVRFGERILSDAPGSIRYLPKESDASVYEVESFTANECVDFYFDSTSPLPREAVGRLGMASLWPLFDRAERVWRAHGTGYYAETMAILYEIIRRLQVSEESYLTGAQNARLEPAIAYLSEHYADCDFDFTAMCAATSLSYDYFKALFKKRFGMPPVKYLTAYRLERAKELLITGRVSVSAAAAAVGFENVYYFSNVFKRQNGVSPRAWRQGLAALGVKS